MSGVQLGDAMEIDSHSRERSPTRETQLEGDLLRDEISDEFEIVHHEGLDDAPFYQQPNIPLGSETKLSGIEQNDDAKDSRDEAEQAPTREAEAKDSEPSALILQQQISELCSKFIILESSSRSPSKIGELGCEECVLTANIKDRQRFEETIQSLTEREMEREETVHNLLNRQESLMGLLQDQKELEERYKAALGLLEKEKRAREESELNLRSEIATAHGLYRKEKERAQKLMKTMAEMQSADPFKLDNNTIISAVKELRYDIKNWARAQRLIPSLPVQGVITTYANRALGREKGPNYEFLKEITPNYQEYTDSPQDFKWLLQAYIWKRLVDMIFVDDLWAGTRKSLDDEETDYKLPLGYRFMKQRLQPGETSTPEYISQYHTWRHTTARLLIRKLTPARAARTVSLIRTALLAPLMHACRDSATPHSPHAHAHAHGLEQEFHALDDLEALIGNALKLAADLAAQKAAFAFDFVPARALGRVEWDAGVMVDVWGPGHADDGEDGGGDYGDERGQRRVVVLGVAPRLVKWGSSEGVGFGVCTQLLEGEVETRFVPKRGGGRR